MKYEALCNLSAGKDHRYAKGQIVSLDPKVAEPFVKAGHMRPLDAVESEAQVTLSDSSEELSAEDGAPEKKKKGKK